MPLTRRPEPFDHADWIFELKYDGSRALAQFRDGECQLVSRNGNRFASFAPLADELASSVRVRTAVLDGEIVWIDRFATLKRFVIESPDLGVCSPCAEECDRG